MEKANVTQERTLQAWWRWFRTLKENPIYQREAGLIGDPNPFYTNLRRYAFFLLVAAIALGGCGGVSNRSLLIGLDTNTAILWGLICIPGVLISIITFYGMLMAPALTAPALSGELDKGTWDILRLTPQPLSQIIFAKLLGGLARLGIWKWLLVLTLIEGGVLFFGGIFTEGALFGVGIVGGLTAVIRPWLEVLFSGFLGMYLSTWIRTAPVTLACTYGGILLFRMLNSSILWFAIFGGFLGIDDIGTLAAGMFIQSLIYVAALIILAFSIIKRAEKYV